MHVMISHNFLYMITSTLCLKKNDSDVAHYNFNAHQPILVIFSEILLKEYAIKS